MRLPASQAAALEKITAAVAGCDPLVMMPGYPSVYFWSGLKAPTGQNAAGWVKLFQAGRQQEVVDAIEDKPGLCVIRNEEAIKANYAIGRVDAAAADARPLRRYLATTPLVTKLDVDTGVQLGHLTLMVRPPAGRRDRARAR